MGGFTIHTAVIHLQLQSHRRLQNKICIIENNVLHLQHQFQLMNLQNGHRNPPKKIHAASQYARHAVC